MRQVEVTIQNLIGSGMDPKTENNPYLGFIYTSFQVGAGLCCAVLGGGPRVLEQAVSSLEGWVGDGCWRWPGS